MSVPCPANPPPPPNTTIWPHTRPVPLALRQWAAAQLHYPRGTVIADTVDGVDVVGRLEWHFHDPGGPIKPWGCHKGLTLYAPTAPILAGVTLPTTAPPGPAVALCDPWIDAGQGGWILVASRGSLGLSAAAAWFAQW